MPGIDLFGKSNLEFYIEGLEKLQKFDNWQPVLEYWLGVAQQQSLDKLTKDAKANIKEYAKHYTGNLAGGFETEVTSYFLPIMSGHVTNAVPYAMRREYGFSGMTDSLGRTYNDDPGYLYLTEAFHEDFDYIRRKYKWAVNKALAALKTLAS